MTETCAADAVSDTQLAAALALVGADGAYSECFADCASECTMTEVAEWAESEGLIDGDSRDWWMTGRRRPGMTCESCMSDACASDEAPTGPGEEDEEGEEGEEATDAPEGAASEEEDGEEATDEPEGAEEEEGEEGEAEEGEAESDEEDEATQGVTDSPSDDGDSRDWWMTGRRRWYSYESGNFDVNADV